MRGSAAGAHASVLGVRISSPDKALWPNAAGDERPVTKLELAQYLAAVGPWMMAHLRGRPCSVVRTPEGIAGERFFQRHGARGLSRRVGTVRLAGDDKPYLQVDRVEGLVALAQIGATEFHPWNCRPFAPETPGRLVFDLDPGPEIAFDQVVAAALDLRERLERVDLVSFCKTTGGKGLHVVVPIDEPRLGWPAARAFAKGLCAAMAADSPDRYVVKMSKAARVGRIFLDYLRNDRMATAVAPLSPRARAGASVSFPLVWREVAAGLDPMRYTIRSAPALLGASRAWADYDEAARPLSPAIRAFSRRSRL